MPGGALPGASSVYLSAHIPSQGPHLAAGNLEQLGFTARRLVGGVLHSAACDMNDPIGTPGSLLAPERDGTLGGTLAYVYYTYEQAANP